MATIFYLLGNYKGNYIHYFTNIDPYETKVGLKSNAT